MSDPDDTQDQGAPDQYLNLVRAEDGMVHVSVTGQEDVVHCFDDTEMAQFAEGILDGRLNLAAALLAAA